MAELDVSSDGSRIVVGQLTGTDAAGNEYFHLYMHVGNDPVTIDLTPGVTTGALYDGMTADGSIVYFTTEIPSPRPPTRTPTRAPTSSEPMSHRQRDPHPGLGWDRHWQHRRLRPGAECHQ